VLRNFKLVEDHAVYVIAASPKDMAGIQTTGQLGLGWRTIPLIRTVRCTRIFHYHISHPSPVSVGKSQQGN